MATLWVKRTSDEVFVFQPRPEDRLTKRAKRAKRDRVPEWNPHASYHRDGRFHSKSFDQKMGESQQRQLLDNSFKGTEHLGKYVGHAPLCACDPSDLSGVIKVEPGVLTNTDGWVTVDLVEPGSQPAHWHFMPKDRIVAQRVFCDAIPWVVITIGQGSD